MNTDISWCQILVKNIKKNCVQVFNENISRKCLAVLKAASYINLIYKKYITCGKYNW